EDDGVTKKFGHMVIRKAERPRPLYPSSATAMPPEKGYRLCVKSTVVARSAGALPHTPPSPGGRGAARAGFALGCPPHNRLVATAGVKAKPLRGGLSASLDPDFRWKVRSRGRGYVTMGLSPVHRDR